MRLERGSLVAITASSAAKARVKLGRNRGQWTACWCLTRFNLTARPTAKILFLQATHSTAHAATTITPITITVTTTTAVAAIGRLSWPHSSLAGEHLGGAPCHTTPTTATCSTPTDRMP